MIVWISFFVLISLFLAIDLGVLNKNAHEISYKEATRWTIVWVTIGILFSGVIYTIYQHDWLEFAHLGTNPLEASIEYLTGYIIELTLSIDNIFVIALIFKSFRIPLKYQHRVLFWGILGALVFRGIMIVFGVVMIERFSWTTYIFGAFLIFTSYKMVFTNEENQFDPKKSYTYRILRRLFPVTSRIEDQKFFIRRKNLRFATPLFVALILIEITDVLFALDSIPAILGITTDPFLVFTSNIFAILGLRSMYFFIANMLDSFHYLKYSLVVILIYVGVKLILTNHYHISIGISLAIILVSLLAGIFFSLQYRKKHPIEG